MLLLSTKLFSFSILYFEDRDLIISHEQRSWVAAHIGDKRDDYELNVDHSLIERSAIKRNLSKKMFCIYLI